MAGPWEQYAQQNPQPTVQSNDPPFMANMPQKERDKVNVDRYDEGRKRLGELDTQISSASSIMDDLNEFGRLNRESGTGSWWQQLTPNKQMFRSPKSMEMVAIQSRLGPSQRVVNSGSSSDKDVSLFLRGLPSLENEGPVNAGIREDFKRKYDYAISKRSAMQRHLDKYGNLSGFDSSWADQQRKFSGAGGVSMLDSSNKDVRSEADKILGL
jgi:hypothetical protein